MDFIYSRLNNNLIDINRLNTITLLKCEKDGTPIERLKVGDYYLKFTIVDSDRISYCDLSSLNKDDKDLLDRIINDEKTFDQRIIDLENNLNTKIDDLDKSIDERITKDEEYFGERCLYKSTSNASKWESKEGSFTGYLGNQSETAVKAKVGFNIENNISYLPSYPTVTGTYYEFNSQDNALTGKLNLTPINSNASPLFSFTGSGTLLMGQRNIYLDSNWFNQSTDNINLCLPAKSGNLITENDAMGCVYIEVEDLETEEVVLTLDQYNYLVKYPKAMFALSKLINEISLIYNDRYFYKVSEDTFITVVSNDCIGRAIISRDTDRDYLKISYYNNASKEELEKVQNILNQEISDRKTAIETEQIRAQREENDIRTNLSQEITTRETEIQELQEECSNITQGIQEFSNSVDIKFQEKELEITKNTDNITNINNIINDYISKTDNHLDTLDSTTDSLQSTINNLIDKEAEDVLTVKNSIIKEIEDRQNADTKLQNDINNEVSTRETQYNDLQSQIDTEVRRAEKAEDILQTNLTTEITNLQQAIDDEHIAREYNDNDIRSIAHTWKSEIDSNFSTLDTTITNLESSLDQEIDTRNTEDKNLQTTISSEISRAKNREDEIESNFNNKITKVNEDITNALTESKQYTDNMVNNEKTRAIGEEESLSSRIQTIEKTIDSGTYSTMASLVFEEI